MSQWGHVHQTWRFHLMYKPVGTTVIREHDTFYSLLLSSILVGSLCFKWLECN
jgi:hypothetical protein